LGSFGAKRLMGGGEKLVQLLTKRSDAGMAQARVQDRAVA